MATNRQAATAAHPNQAPVEPYPGLSRILHWIVAALVFATWPLGLMIGYVKKEVSLDFYLLHESIGFLVIWVMLLRIGTKIVAGAPEIEGTALERMAAHSVHGLLYVFLIIMPVSGFLATNAHGFPLHWFGLFEVWSPLGKSPEIAGTLSGIHFWSAWILFGLFCVHFAAALFHHVVKRDGTLLKMI